ncbi:hypothetical protein C2869_10955 [Saccharobesus litoralis]|uniref:histidine kinase n=1 Tax=Saccharobesus litoralis TaxID=2172099 RepID=A0A2S0VRY1_9ALTE|nr:ABC transporter substrate-binding protein [Saccharobesus litoralis]AWB66922.1 hypothetical protein C2869_10955 [Saccharobesus litoralis]
MATNKTFLFILLTCCSYWLHAAESVILQLKWKHQFQFAGYYAALEKGYYANASFDVTIKERDTLSTPFDNILLGKADFAIADSSIVLKRLNGQPFVVVSSVFQHSPLALMVKRSSNIRSPYDLINKRVMFQKGVDGATITAMFNRLGIKQEQFNFIPHNFDDLALHNNVTDAMSVYTTDQPYLYLQKNVDTLIIEPANYGIDFYGDLIFTRQDYAEKYPQRAREFASASLQGWQYALANPEEITNLIIKKYAPNADKQKLLHEAKTSAPLINADVIPLGTTIKERFFRIAAIYKELDMAPNDASIEGLLLASYEKPQASISAHWLYVGLAVVGLLLLSITLLSLFNWRLKRAIDKKSAELNINEAKFKAIIEHAPIMINSFDEQGVCLLWNSCCVSTLGYSHQDIIDCDDPMHLFYPDDAIKQQVYQDINKADGHFREYQVQIRNGKQRYQMWANFKLPSGAAIAIGYDVTKQRLAEQEILEQQQHLLTLSKEAEAASHAKSEFLANMSHEIRTPMNGVYGTLQLLANSVADNDKALLDNATLSCKSLLAIINDILDFSKIEAGKMSLEQVRFSFKEIVTQVAHEFDHQASQQSTVLEIDIAKDYTDGWIGDPTKIRQILVNLVSNAIKFTQMGVVRIHVDSSLTANKSELKFSVEDNGIGMDPQAVDKLFSRFEQADNSTTRKYGGTGLGMAICSKLIEKMQGYTQVNSEINKGTKIEVCLPLPTASLECETTTNTTKQIPDLTGRKILLAEDNEINQIIFVSMMAKTHADIQVAANGLQAISLVEEFAPELIFMDIQMPEMDGLEACERIREQHPNLPIIALTANVIEQDIKKYKERGFNGHVGKPIELAELYKATHIHLALSSNDLVDPTRT